MIKPEELHYARYYNEKKVASGGDIISTLPKARRELHKKRSIAAQQKGWKLWYENVDPKELSARGKHARSCVKKPSWGGAAGELNHFYGKHHTEETKRKMSAHMRNQTPHNIHSFKVSLSDGSVYVFNGMQSIRDKYCLLTPLKFERFIDTNKPCSSNRKSAIGNKLLGATIARIY